MVFESIGQDQWGGGIFRGRRAPADSVFDAVDGLINDERELFRRGGSAFKSTADVNDVLKLLWDGHVSAGPRTLFQSAAETMYTLDVDDASPVNVGQFVASVSRPFSRPAALGGYVAFPAVTSGVTPTVLLYAGSRKTAGYSTGTVAVTAGGTTVTGTGTSWLANVDAGMILTVGVLSGIVKSVESNTSLTLTAGWSGSTASGQAYLLSAWRVVILPLPSIAALVTEGPRDPVTAVDDAGVGTVAWSSPGSVVSSNDARATAVIPTNPGVGLTTHYLKTTNFGFGVPTDATIKGIVVEIERSTGGGTVRDARVRIVKGGAIQATDRASATNWPAADAYKAYGSQSDLWGATWSPADINSSGFGVALAALDVTAGGATARVDHIRITVYFAPATAGAVGQSAYLAAVGTVPRLLACLQGRVYFTEPGSVVFDAALYHELAAGSVITGATAIDDTAVVFTTGGVWAISNMNFDPLDDVGNVQHQVAQISPDVILWGDSGIAAYAGGLVVPAIDDVYVMTLGGEPVAVSGAIRPLYREYVEAGFKPGTGAVFRSHYLLPILDSANVVQDVLVCRLDLRDDSGARRPALTRWANHAAAGAYAVRVGADTREPKLLAINGLRVTDLTGCFDPEAGNKEDADGTDHKLVVITNDKDTGPGLHKNYVANARVEYELVDAAADNPTVSVSYAVGSEAAAFSAATLTRGGVETTDASDYSAWRIGKDAERIRLKIETNGPCASAILRRLELEVEQAGW